MNKFIRFFLLAFLSFALSLSLYDTTYAKGKGHGGYHSSSYRSSGHRSYKSSSSGTIKVKSYHRKDGTYVSSHSSSAHSSKNTTYAPRTKGSSITSKRTNKSDTLSSNTGVKRDSKGRIKRSSAARTAFKHSHPCPSTGKSSGPCPGYVIDHVQALKHGGADSPSNMQWQTIEAAKAKDKIE